VTMNQARYWLMGVFFAGLMLQLGALFHIRNGMWPEEFQTVILRILGIYSAQLGVVLGAIFARPKAASASPSPGLTWTALALAFIWNFLLVWRTIAFSVSEQDSTTDLIKYLDSIAAGSSFLVAGALAFFFSKSADTSSSTA